MHDQSDAQLLREYAEHGAEAAFAEIVARHTDLVFSAALRQVYSPDLARDVTQSVFTDLARNARTISANLSPVASLVGWLYRGTRFAARDLYRNETRRNQRERQAMEQLHPAPETPPDWEQLRPVLDDAMSELDDPERDAVLLRYFKNHDLRTVGAALGISDDAAQKRVSRAVEKLRDIFAKRKITIGAGSLGVLISAHAAQAAPIGMAVTISTAAVLTGTPLATAATVTATKAVAMTALQKTIVTATIAVLAGAGIYETRQASQLRDQVHTLQQQQAPLAEQIQRLLSELDATSNRVVGLNEELASATKNNAELLKLRGEVGVLRNASRSSSQAIPADVSLEAAARNWLNRANQLKNYVQQNPDENIPELQFLTDREWLIISGDTGLDTEDFRTPDDFRRGLELLRTQAESRFGNKVSTALRMYASANNGEIPAELSQLKPFCDSSVGELLVQSYEIKPSTVLSP